MKALQPLECAERLPRAVASPWVLASIMTLALAACGGGGAGDAPAGPPAGNASVSEGTLTGFGSVFVDGSEFDVSTATITDDLGNVAPLDALKLGMHVELAGTDPDPSSSSGEGTGRTVVYASDLEGPVSAVDPAAGTIRILAQRVDVDAGTVWDTALAGRLAGLAVGEVVKVYALYDSATDRYAATRIEADPAATRYKIRGMVSDLDPVNKSFMIGNLPVDYTGVLGPPGGLADGAVATAELQTTPRDGDTWMATGLQLRTGGVPGNHVNVHVRGLVTSASAPTTFLLDGWSVDASGATFGEGRQGVVAGESVQVDGIMSGGTLVASTVTPLDPGGPTDFQLRGAITSVDPAARTFVLQAQAVSYAGNVAYEDGSSSDLVVGAGVFVRGSLAADGSRVQAASIAFTPGG